MKSPSTFYALVVMASAVWALSSQPEEVANGGFFEALDNHDNFNIAHGYGPERWGCSFTRTQVHETSEGTRITIGKDSELKPYSCGELIYKQTHLGYGTYSIEMIASHVVGQVTSFFLIANEDTEIDIEVTGLNTRVGWMNIWHDQKQNPISINLPFDAAQGWHSYQFEWRPSYVAWFVDGNVVLNRSDIPTTSPQNANYKLEINSWTQVQPEIKLDWAGKFRYPKDGTIPQAHFRNMRHTPWVDPEQIRNGDGVNDGKEGPQPPTDNDSEDRQKSSAESVKKPTGIMHGLSVSPNGPCLGKRIYDPLTKTFGDYVWQTYTEVNDRITRFGSGLIKIHQLAHGLETVGQKWFVGIWAINRPEWTIASEACSAYNLISVGLYDTLGPEAVTYCINHADCSVVVTSANHVATLLSESTKMPGLKAIISMDDLVFDKAGSGLAATGAILRTYAQDKGVLLYDWSEVEAIGGQNARTHAPPTSLDAYTICYTSGTTGLPKGAIVTHGNMVAPLANIDVGLSLTPDECLISFLPLAHQMGRMVELWLFSCGGKIGYGTGDITRLLEDMSYLKPTFFPAVPRLLNRLYAKTHAATAGAPGLMGTLARRGLATKLASFREGKGVHHPFWDRILFSKVKETLGGNVRRIMVGSAPVSAEVLGFIRVAFCCDVVEGYGQTEGSAVASNTHLRETEAGHVGPPAVCSEIKLVDVPELNYSSTDKPFPRGEICVRGPGIIPGYLKDEAKTKETIDEEGWLHSGDVGLISSNGTLVIIDRKKNTFKLSQGEYIAAESIEGRFLSKIPFIQQILVHGDSTESCLVAILIPEPEAFIPFVNKVLKNVQIQPGDLTAYKAILSNPKLTQAGLQELLTVGKEIGLKGFEIPKAVLLESEPFTIENGLLTPTLKTKRHPVVQAYRDRLTALYHEIHQKDSKL
ncbi:hypothetical protein EC968_008454 [Mortierella alpina]|nr:hypothetical protein EC968_008454 [Mortierella alpina]